MSDASSADASSADVRSADDSPANASPADKTASDESPRRFTVPALFHGACLLAEGPPGAPLVLGCHGYGEGASAMAKTLGRLPSASRLHRAAVEAPHPFYTKSGRVVRSWMTKVDRELAIEDNIRYVAAVLSELRRRLDAGPLVVVGFSQGVAMAWRTAVRSGFPCAGLVALAGDVPPDVAATASGARRSGFLPPSLLGRGTEDAWYDEAKMAADLDTLARLGAEVETCVFDGGHEWTGDFYAAADAFIVRHALAESAD